MKLNFKILILVVALFSAIGTYLHLYNKSSIPFSHNNLMRVIRESSDALLYKQFLEAEAKVATLLKSPDSEILEVSVEELRSSHESISSKLETLLQNNDLILLKGVNIGKKGMVQISTFFRYKLDKKFREHYGKKVNVLFSKNNKGKPVGIKLIVTDEHGEIIYGESQSPLEIMLPLVWTEDDSGLSLHGNFRGEKTISSFLYQFGHIIAGSSEFMYISSLYLNEDAGFKFLKAKVDTCGDEFKNARIGLRVNINQGVPSARAYQHQRKYVIDVLFLNYADGSRVPGDKNYYRYRIWYDYDIQRWVIEE